MITETVATFVVVAVTLAGAWRLTGWLGQHLSRIKE